MLIFYVVRTLSRLAIRFTTDLAEIRQLSGVDTAVSHDIPSLSETSLADITRERTFTSVTATMYTEVSAARESFSTNFADVRSLAGVLPCVLL